MGEWIQVAGFIATLIWGAATVKAELRYVRKELSEFKEAASDAAKAVASTLHDHSERIARIEGRIGH